MSFLNCQSSQISMCIYKHLCVWQLASWLTCGWFQTVGSLRDQLKFSISQGTWKSSEVIIQLTHLKSGAWNRELWFFSSHWTTVQWVVQTSGPKMLSKIQVTNIRSLLIILHTHTPLLEQKQENCFPSQMHHFLKGGQFNTKKNNFSSTCVSSPSGNSLSFPKKKKRERDGYNLRIYTSKNLIFMKISSLWNSHYPSCAHMVFSSLTNSHVGITDLTCSKGEGHSFPFLPHTVHQDAHLEELWIIGCSLFKC